VQVFCRFSVGDVLASTTGFQGNGTFAGIGINRNYGALQPERVIRPTGSQSFLLERRATIDVFVNNVRTQQIVLGPGRYALTDLVFVSGASTVQLDITDDAGNRQSMTFDAFSDPDLLQAGLIDFGLNGGLLARSNVSSRTYDSGDMVSTSFVRYGVTDALTAGVNLQTRRRWMPSACLLHCRQGRPLLWARHSHSLQRCRSSPTATGVSRCRGWCRDVTSCA